MRGGTRKVIIADDGPDDRAEIRRLLRDGSGHEARVAEVETGRAAIQACLEAGGGPPDCLILDFDLPDMNALDVLAALRRGGDVPICPVVVLAGDVEWEVGTVVVREGAQDFISRALMSAEGL